MRLHEVPLLSTRDAAYLKLKIYLIYLVILFLLVWVKPQALLTDVPAKSLSVGKHFDIFNPSYLTIAVSFQFLLHPSN